VADFATVADVSGLRTLSPAEETRAALLLGYGSALIRQKVPDIDARIATGALDVAIPRMVAVSMVLRGLQQLAATPGAKSESTTTGPYTHAVTYAEAVGSGLIRLFDDELASLLPRPSGSASSGVGTIRLSPGFGAPWGSAPIW